VIGVRAERGFFFGLPMEHVVRRDAAMRNTICQLCLRILCLTVQGICVGFVFSMGAIIKHRVFSLGCYIPNLHHLA